MAYKRKLKETQEPEEESEEEEQEKQESNFIPFISKGNHRLQTYENGLMLKEILDILRKG